MVGRFAGLYSTWDKSSGSRVAGWHDMQTEQQKRSSTSRRWLYPCHIRQERVHDEMRWHRGLRVSVLSSLSQNSPCHKAEAIHSTLAQNHTSWLSLINIQFIVKIPKPTYAHRLSPHSHKAKAHPTMQPCYLCAHPTAPKAQRPD